MLLINLSNSLFSRFVTDRERKYEGEVMFSIMFICLFRGGGGVPVLWCAEKLSHDAMGS